jgi:integrase
MYINFLYSTGIRPKELLGIQIKDFDLDKALIRLSPYNERTKTKKERTVTMNAQLLKYVSDSILDKDLPGEWQFFSENFQPGEKRIDRRVATALWDLYVRGHLGIDKFMYSMKHLGADDLAEAAKKKGIKKENIEELVQNNLGHSKKFMTRRYTKKGIEINQNIIRKIAPAL